MSLEQALKETTAAIEKLTATLASKSTVAGASATETKAPATKPAATKPAAKKNAAKPAADDLDLDLDTPADDDLDLDTPADDDLDFGDEEEAEAEVTVTKEVITPDFKKLAKATGGRESVQSILKAFKATQFQDLDPKHFAAAHAKVKAELKRLGVK